ISSGGSIARNSGSKAAIVETSATLSAQRHVDNPSPFILGIRFLMLSRGAFDSLWLSSEPAHPDPFSASGITAPVLFPSLLSSTLWLKTGTVVLETTACSI